MEKGLFLCFLLAAAGQDLKRKQVDVRIYLIFGAAAVMLEICRWIGPGGLQSCKWMEAGGLGISRWIGPGGLLWEEDGCGLWERAAGILPGLILLGTSRISCGGIGTGDGWFFLVSGLMLGFWENLALLCYSTLCCGIFCLGYFVWEIIKRGENPGRRTVPFLPFAVLPGVWLAARGMGWLL